MILRGSWGLLPIKLSLFRRHSQLIVIRYDTTIGRYNLGLMDVLSSCQLRFEVAYSINLNTTNRYTGIRFHPL